MAIEQVKTSLQSFLLKLIKLKRWLNKTIRVEEADPEIDLSKLTRSKFKG